MLFGVMQEAWESVFPLEFGFVNAETNTQFAGIVTPSEVVVVSSFHIELEGGAGTLHVTLPYTMIEPIRDLLTDGAKGAGSDRDEHWVHVMHEEMKNAVVDLHAMLTRTELSLGDVMRLKAGDIVPIDLPQTVVAKVDDVPVFRGTYGASRGRAALKVVEPICHADYYSESQLTGASK
jgi:flagellar motor switch protein FliM